MSIPEMTIPEWMLIECSDHPAWPLMVKEAIKYGLPKYYVRDLHYHDVEALERLPRKYPFHWGLRECGTHLIEEPSVYSLIKDTSSTLRWYHWDGNDLVKL